MDVLFSGPQVVDGGPAGGEAHLWLMVLQELREMKGLALTWTLHAHGGHPGYWTRLAYRINVVFFTFYVAVALLFLTLMVKEWQS